MNIKILFDADSLESPLGIHQNRWGFHGAVAMAAFREDRDCLDCNYMGCFTYTSVKNRRIRIGRW